MATILYGEPRFTNDVDVVVDLAEPLIPAFCGKFPAHEFYVSEAAVRAAVRDKSQFNIIHPESGLKADIIIPELNPFSRSRFARAKHIRAADDFETWFASPEDAIIKKLDCYRQAGSEKHLRDIAGILKTSSNQLDIPYIERWAATLGLQSEWTAVLTSLRAKD